MPDGEPLYFPGLEKARPAVTSLPKHKEGQPLSFDAVLSWTSVAEKPAENTPQSEKPEKNYYQDYDYQKLRAEAIDYLDGNKSGKYYLAEMFRRFYGRSDGLSIQPNHEPPEYHTLVNLMGQYGYGREGTHQEQIAEAIFQSIYYIRKDANSDRASWNSSFPFSGFNPKAEGAITHYLSEHFTHQHTQVTKTPLNVFDATVLAVLSTGDVATAINIVNQADRLMGRENATQDAWARLASDQFTNLFEKAREYYSASAKQRYDATFAFMSLDKLPPSARPTIEILAKGARERLQTEATETRNKWYREHRVADIKARENLLTEEAEKALTDKMAQAQGNWEQIHEEVEQRCKDVVIAKVSNSLAAEIGRRLHPEATVDSLFKRTSSRSQMPGLGRTEFRDFFQKRAPDRQGYVEMTPQERQEMIDQGKFPGVDKTESHFRDAWARPEELGAAELIALLRNPRLSIYYIDDGLNSVMRRTQGTIKTRAEYLAHIAARLVPAVTFLQTLSENEFMSEVLAREFGLTKDFLRQAFDPYDDQRNVNVQLRKFFSQGSEDPDFYLQLLEGDQETEDGRRIDLITQAANNEITSLVTAKTGETALVVRSMHDQAIAEVETKKAEREVGLKEQTNNTDAQQAKVAEIQAANTALTEAKRKTDGRAVFNRGQKMADLVAAQARVQALEKELGAMVEAAGKISVLTEVEITRANERVQRLERVLPPQ